MKTLISSTYATNASRTTPPPGSAIRLFHLGRGQADIYSAIKNRVTAMWNNNRSGFVAFQPQPPAAPALPRRQTNATGVANSVAGLEYRAVRRQLRRVSRHLVREHVLGRQRSGATREQPTDDVPLPPALQPGTSYFWKVVSRTNATPVNASMVGASSTGSFTTAAGSGGGGVPGTPTSPSPGTGATGVSTTPTLTWSAAGASSYDVKFGTSNPPPTVSTISGG